MISMKLDIHHIEYSLKRVLERIDRLPNDDKKILLAFKRDLEKKGLSNTRVLFYLIRLAKLSLINVKCLGMLNKEDIEDIVIKIEKSKFSKKKDSKEYRNYAEWTKAGYKTAIRRFFTWYKPDIDLSWLKTGVKKSKLNDPIVLTKEEILEIFRCAEGSFEKSIVSFMYESGCRSPDELLNMKVDDVEFNDVGAKVKLTSGKVGSRTILIISCVPHLKTWLENHPNPKNNSYLWSKNSHAINYKTLQRMIKKWVEKAGITKRVTAYTFRRTRYTHLANKIPTPALYKYMGQVQGSKVIDRYVALSTEDTDEAIMAFHGLVIPKNMDIKAKFCSRCGKQNPSELEYCNICHSPLTEKARVESEDKKRLELTDLVEELIRKRMEELKT